MLVLFGSRSLLPAARLVLHSLVHQRLVPRSNSDGTPNWVHFAMRLRLDKLSPPRSTVVEAQASWASSRAGVLPGSSVVFVCTADWLWLASIRRAPLDVMLEPWAPQDSFPPPTCNTS